MDDYKNIHFRVDSRFGDNHSDLSFDPVPLHGLSITARNTDGISKMRIVVGTDIDTEKSVLFYSASIEQRFDFIGSLYTVSLLQTAHLLCNKKTPKKHLFRCLTGIKDCVSLRFKCLGGKFLSPFGPSFSDDLSTAGRRHPLSEPVLPRTTAFARLICTLHDCPS